MSKVKYVLKIACTLEWMYAQNWEEKMLALRNCCLRSNWHWIHLLVLFKGKAEKMCCNKARWNEKDPQSMPHTITMSRREIMKKGASISSHFNILHSNYKFSILNWIFFILTALQLELFDNESLNSSWHFGKNAFSIIKSLRGRNHPDTA